MVTKSLTLKRNNRLVLGTVQLGMPYGVANKTGQPDRKMALEIIRAAWDNGIREFDTAQGYGNSESVLGKVFAKLGISNRVRVVSKFDPQLNHGDSKILRTALEESLKRLSVPSLYAILLHDENLLDQWNNGVGDNLRALIKSGKVKKIGVSIYSPAKAMLALSSPGIDIIQLPVNIFDDRFINERFLNRAKERRIALYARSIFLQGLLTMAIKDVPACLSSAKRFLKQLDGFCEKYHLTRQDLALGYVRSRMPQAKIVVGVETLMQLNDDIRSWGHDYPGVVNRQIQKVFVNLPAKIVNPVLWKI